MNAQEKTEFVTVLINQVRDDILAKIRRMPDTWDGHELRQYIKDQFASVVWQGTDMRTNRKRMRDYRNICLTTPLL